MFRHRQSAGIDFILRAADGKIYFVGREGMTVVIRDDSATEIFSKNFIAGTFDASPVVVGRPLLLRSWTKLQM